MEGWEPAFGRQNLLSEGEVGRLEGWKRGWERAFGRQNLLSEGMESWNGDGNGAEASSLQKRKRRD